MVCLCRSPSPRGLLLIAFPPPSLLSSSLSPNGLFDLVGFPRDMVPLPFTPSAVSSSPKGLLLLLLLVVGGGRRWREVVDSGGIDWLILFFPFLTTRPTLLLSMSSLSSSNGFWVLRLPLLSFSSTPSSSSSSSSSKGLAFLAEEDDGIDFFFRANNANGSTMA